MKSIREYVSSDTLLEFKARRSSSMKTDGFPDRPIKEDVIKFLESKGFTKDRSITNVFGLMKKDIQNRTYTTGEYNGEPSTHWIVFCEKNAHIGYILYTGIGITENHALNFGYFDSRAKWWKCETYEEFLSLLKRDFGW